MKTNLRRLTGSSGPIGLGEGSTVEHSDIRWSKAEGILTVRVVFETQSSFRLVC